MVFLAASVAGESEASRQGYPEQEADDRLRPLRQPRRINNGYPGKFDYPHSCFLLPLTILPSLLLSSLSLSLMGNGWMDGCGFFSGVLLCRWEVLMHQVHGFLPLPVLRRPQEHRSAPQNRLRLAAAGWLAYSWLPFHTALGLLQKACFPKKTGAAEAKRSNLAACFFY